MAELTKKNATYTNLTETTVLDTLFDEWALSRTVHEKHNNGCLSWVTLVLEMLSDSVRKYWGLYVTEVKGEQYIDRCKMKKSAVGN